MGFMDGLRTVEKLVGIDVKTVRCHVKAARGTGSSATPGEAQLNLSSLWHRETASGADGVFCARSEWPEAFRRHMPGAAHVNRT
jgi:hypothetical protein